MPSLYTLVLRLLCFVIAIPVHEAAHAWAAYKLGDPTAKNMGRLTLNPAVHLDPMGALCMVVAGVGWAKAVPINTWNFKDRKKGMLLSALAGPAANLCLAFVMLVLAKVFVYSGMLIVGTYTGVFATVSNILFTLVVMNIYLAIFNLLPVPPLDGSRIAAAVLPEKQYFKIMEYEQYIFIALMACLVLGVFNAPLSFISDIVYAVINFLTGFIDIFFRLFL